MRISSLVLFFALAGCAEFPALDARVGPEALEAPFPTLLPMEQLLDASAPPISIVSGPGSNRIAALRARAARLRGPVVDQATRLRMQQGVQPAH